MPSSEKTQSGSSAGDTAVARVLLHAVAAWAVPGAGHWLLGRRRRALFYLAVVTVALVCGVFLHGRIAANAPGQPLAGLATLGTMGAGAAYFVLRLAGYQGDLLAHSYEYGTAFLISAGVMNWLLVLDVWDIGMGRKE